MRATGPIIADASSCMIPVKLQLTNFLSYGTEAPPLHFDRFHVACLSGRNGQGKSALLDAITWALWGEARKASGNRKPDDDLIRIGTRHMQVELVFDVEGARYRISRTYQRSATGKTTKSTLEFHLFEPEAGDYRPRTGASQRETQQLIDKTLGLDYDTFINSAFLLQGRSDEFTKKKPSQRKEILARILDLGRYKRLARLAGTRSRAARDRRQSAARDIERLEEGLKEVPAWKRERSALRDEINEHRKRLRALRTEEKNLTQRLADLKAKAREAASVEESIAARTQHIAEAEGEIEELGARIDEAQRLLDQKEEIERNYDRYEALGRERDALDTKRDLHRSLEKQIDRRRAAVKDRRSELENTLHRLKLDAKSKQQKLREIDGQLAKRQALRQSLKQARTARTRYGEMDALRTQREALREEKAQREAALKSRREALQARLGTLEEQIARRAKALADPEVLTRRREQLKGELVCLQKLRRRQEQVTEEGKALGEGIREEEGLLSAWAEEHRKKEQQLARLRAETGGACPTCGATLTPAHRREVETRLEGALAEMKTRRDDKHAALEEKKQQREERLATYRQVQEKLSAFDGTAEALATVREQLRTQKAEAEAQREQRAAAETLRTRISEKSYGEEARARWRACCKKLEALAFDEEAYARLQQQSAQVENYETQLDELEDAAQRKEQVAQQLAADREQIEKLHARLDDASAFEDLNRQIEQLTGQLKGVGFDGERFEAVRAALRTLAEAGSRMKDLLHARQNRDDWKAQRERLKQRLTGLRKEQDAAAEKLQALRKAHEEKEAVEEKRQAVGEAREETEQAAGTLQQRIGELNARLERATSDRARLDTRRQEHQEARAQQALYKHLRTAFGRHGIPSLIIEQTLPEIEERANDLLERLTDGRMHVRLETLKDKKTGGTKETLDIIITDEQGVPRPYETFSGGEAFRVNFALRIALAQLLAERSGVRIRTLVIDEGFGTQDRQGIQHLVEAIRIIRADFDKIIVITHLEELKQVFPVRIEVAKDPATGSSFEMLGV